MTQIGYIEYDLAMETQWKGNGKNIQMGGVNVQSFKKQVSNFLHYFFWLKVKITGQLYTFWNEVYLFETQIWPPKEQNSDF